LKALLRPRGRLLNHAISSPDTRGGRVPPRSFIGRYVFPDGHLLEVGTVITAMQDLHLEVRDVESLREHYARTLRAWVANLEGSWDEAVRLVGAGRARVWRLYMAASAVNFEANRTAIHQVLAVNTPSDGSSAIPATRTWLDIREQAAV
jgi:cyclopropane-fatty-acyl-phospholipid synthase